MNENKLFSVLSRLSVSELNRFIEFVQSPYFNKRNSLKSIIIYVKSFSPNLNHPKLTPLEIWKHLFPDKEYNNTNYHLEISYLFKALEKFLAVNYITHDRYAMNAALLTQLNSKSSYYVYKATIKNFYKQCDEIKIKDVAYFNYKGLLNKCAIDLCSKDGANKIQHLQLEDDCFSFKLIKLKYFIETLIEYFDYIVIHRYADHNANTNWVSAIIIEIENNKTDYFQLPLIYIYYHLYKYHKSICNTFNHLLLLKHILKIKNEISIDSYEKIWSHFLMMINLKGFDGITLNKKNELQIRVFKEIIASRSEHHVWNFQVVSFYATAYQTNEDILFAEHFIANELSHMYKHTQEHVFLIIKTQICFAQKNYKDALYFISQIKIKNAYDYIDINTFKLCILYYHDQCSQVIGAINSFKLYLYRCTACDKQIIESVFRFLKTLNKIAAYSLKYQANPIELFQKILSLKNELEHDSSTVFSYLLLQKIIDDKIQNLEEEDVAVYEINNKKTS